MLRSLPILILLALLAACSTPSETFTARAKRIDLLPSTVTGELFQHRVFWNAGARQLAATKDAGAASPGAAPGERILHIYLGGDGVPWKGGHPTSDPTPRNPLMLRLIALDSHPAVFLGRPCFHGFSETAPCTWPYWNDARYAEPIVASMTAAMQEVISETGASKAVLFGASGGGALAVLMADRSDNVAGIITVAANLDVATWLAYSQYDGMHESLDPATDGRKNAARNARVFERHYAGSKDKVVPPHTAIKGLRRPDEMIIVPEFDHNCCWSEIWPEVLAETAKLEGSADPAPPAAAAKEVEPSAPAKIGTQVQAPAPPSVQEHPSVLKHLKSWF